MTYGIFYVFIAFLKKYFACLILDVVLCIWLYFYTENLLGYSV